MCAQNKILFQLLLLLVINSGTETQGTQECRQFNMVQISTDCPCIT